MTFQTITKESELKKELKKLQKEKGIIQEKIDKLLIAIPAAAMNKGRPSRFL